VQLAGICQLKINDLNKLVLNQFKPFDKKGYCPNNAKKQKYPVNDPCEKNREKTRKKPERQAKRQRKGQRKGQRKAEGKYSVTRSCKRRN